MSTTYNYQVLPGDTFESIARKVYGTEVDSGRIASANPGTVEPLTPGVSIIIPILPAAPGDRVYEAPAAGPNEVSILIDGKRFRFWESVNIVRSVDSFDTAGFTAPFSADIPEFRDTFRPFSYKPFSISVGGSRLFSGTMVSINPDLAPARKAVSVNGYSSPGVFNDCTPPASSFPLEFNKQTLREIATTLAAPFGISVEFGADQGPIFKRVAIEPGKKVLAFIIELAKARNLIVSNTAGGALLFHRPEESASIVATLRQGLPPLTHVTPKFAPQAYYSHITGLEPVYLGLGGSQYTVKNPRLTGALRPLTFKTRDSEAADVAASVNAKISRMFGSAVGYSAQVATWRTPGGAVWEPGTTLILDAPDAMVYGEYKFIIRRVTLTRTQDDESAMLDLVLPGSFSGKVPEVLPWEN